MKFKTVIGIFSWFGLVKVCNGDLHDQFVCFVDVVYNGPVCLDSNVTFSAQLSPACYCSFCESYTFVWNTTAWKLPPLKTESTEMSSNVSMLFTRYLDEIGQYPMNVTVLCNYKWFALLPMPTSLLTSNSILFNLTENLHLNLRVDQNYSRRDLPPNSSAYAVGSPVVALVEIVELFEQSEYRYCWTVDENSTCSRFPNYTVNFNSSGEHKIGIVTYASINLTDNDGNFHIDERISENITKTITLKDVVSDLIIHASEKLQLDQVFRATISYSGSGPFDIYWNILNSSFEVLHEAAIFNSVHRQQVIWYSFEQPGRYNLSVSSRNEVSSSDVFFHVDVVGIPAVDYHVPASLPIVCILIGLVSLTAIVVPFLYSKHPRPVETANFDFQSSDTYDQPSGSRKKLQDWLKKVAAKWKGLQARRLSFLGTSNSTMNFELERIPIVNYRTYGTGNVDIIT